MNSVTIISINYMDFLFKFLDECVTMVTLFNLPASISCLLPDYVAMTTAKHLICVSFACKWHKQS